MDIDWHDDKCNNKVIKIDNNSFKLQLTHVYKSYVTRWVSIYRNAYFVCSGRSTCNHVYYGEWGGLGLEEDWGLNFCHVSMRSIFPKYILSYHTSKDSLWDVY